MGYFSDLSIQGPTSDKIICYRCVINDSLKKFIKTNACFNDCSFCNKKSNTKPTSIMVNDLSDHILECIECDYEDSPFIFKESAFMEEDNTVSTEDILYNYDVSDNVLAIQELLQLLPENRWLDYKDWYGVYVPLWEDFVRALENITNFDEGFDIADSEYSDIFRSNEVLETLFECINRLGLFKTIGRKRILYRARSGNKECNLNEFGAHTSTNNNRMNPKGHPMLYMSFNKKAAEAECRSDRVATVAHFNLRCNSNFIDLSNDLPSCIFFNLELKQKVREFYTFISAFISTISESSNNDQFYRPIQYVIHHLRKSTLLKLSCQGIIYKSAKLPKYKNVALWADINSPIVNQVSSINSAIKLLKCEQVS